MKVSQEQLDELFDLLVTEGTVTLDQIMDRLGVPDWHAKKIIHQMRLLFADSDINLVSDPQGVDERWLYSLADNYEKAEPWLLNRLRDGGSRFKTMHAVAKSVSKGLDGHQAYTARMFEIALRQTIELLDILLTGDDS